MAGSDEVLKNVVNIPGLETPVLVPNMQGFERYVWMHSYPLLTFPEPLPLVLVKY